MGNTPFAIEKVMAQYYPPRKLTGKVFWPDLSELEDTNAAFYILEFKATLAGYQTLQRSHVVRGPYYIWGLTANSLNDGTFTVAVKDGRTGQPFMDYQINSGNMAGSGRHPYFLRHMHVVPSQRQLTVLFSDLSGVSNTVQVALLGAVLYD